MLNEKLSPEKLQEIEQEHDSYKNLLIKKEKESQRQTIKDFIQNKEERNKSQSKMEHEDLVKVQAQLESLEDMHENLGMYKYITRKLDELLIEYNPGLIMSLTLAEKK